MEKKVFIVTVNSDFTEGRGPMVYHSCWSTLGEAKRFVENQTGVQGRKQYLDSNHNNGSDTYYSDFTIRHEIVRDHYDPEAKKKAQERVKAAAEEMRQAEAELKKFQ